MVQVAEVPRALAGDARTGVTNCPERALRIEEKARAGSGPVSGVIQRHRGRHHLGLHETMASAWRCAGDGDRERS